MAHIPASGRLLSLSSLPTLICQLSPHISESAFFSDRRGGCTGGLADGARLPDLHSPLQRSRAHILTLGVSTGVPPRPAGVDCSPMSIPHPPATLPITARVSLKNTNQVMSFCPENLLGLPIKLRMKATSLPQFQDSPYAPLPSSQMSSH